MPLLLCLLLAGCSRGVPSADVIYTQLHSTDKLKLSTMRITKTARLEDSQWYTVGKRIAVYSYNTYLTAFIDMDRLQPGDISVDEKTRTVTLTLPPIQTQLDGRDINMRRVYENVGVFRSNIDARERAAMKEQANESLRRELRDDSALRARVMEAARHSARSYFTSLLEADGYKAVVKFQPSFLPAL